MTPAGQNRRIRQTRQPTDRASWRTGRTGEPATWRLGGHAEPSHAAPRRAEPRRAEPTGRGHDGRVEILSSRILLRPRDPVASRHFYQDVLGLAVYRQFGPVEAPTLVFFLGQGFLELSGEAAAAGEHPPPWPRARTEAAAGATPLAPTRLWLQVRDVQAAHRELVAAGVAIAREPKTEPWGLIELWTTDPDGLPIVLVEIPPDHPLRRDNRPGLA